MDAERCLEAGSKAWQAGGHARGKEHLLASRSTPVPKMQQRSEALAKGPRVALARIWGLHAGSRVVFPELCFKAVGVSTAMSGKESGSLKPKQLLRVAGDDEGSLPTTSTRSLAAIVVGEAGLSEIIRQSSIEWIIVPGRSLARSPRMIGREKWSTNRCSG